MPRTIECPICQKESEHCARGLCKPCYQSVWSIKDKIRRELRQGSWATGMNRCFDCGSAYYPADFALLILQSGLLWQGVVKEDEIPSLNLCFDCLKRMAQWDKAMALRAGVGLALPVTAALVLCACCGGCYMISPSDGKMAAVVFCPECGCPYEVPDGPA